MSKLEDEKRGFVSYQKESDFIVKGGVQGRSGKSSHKTSNFALQQPIHPTT
ncbi:hypothetical protein DAPPUDRAFT_331442 [Daphnia pulex]|uniref:Uncharacterized protein n=1 Tax=Daphnia pulex TaxID=6669 RepID=E9HMI1_DAPPU|nr:hypothetical protein DAPPUDRAFT_331442 [Daphnia pulex]|eukprot:EFX67024.1 hypothetical protein DAPPUDRAFT_331442 [Daphnia pulex]